MTTDREMMEYFFAFEKNLEDVTDSMKKLNKSVEDFNGTVKVHGKEIIEYQDNRLKYKKARTHELSIKQKNRIDRLQTKISNIVPILE